MTVRGGRRSLSLDFPFFSTGWRVTETQGKTRWGRDLPRRGEATERRSISQCQTRPTSNCREGPDGLFRVLRFLPAAINSSHLQDVKSCGSTKETETNEHQLFYFCIYLFLYLFSFSSNQRPFPATSCISMSFIICVFKMRTKLSRCPPPCMRWGGRSWVGAVGRRRRKWDKSSSPTVEGMIGERPPPGKKHLNLPQQRETYEGEKKKKKENEEDGFQEKKKKTNWFFAVFLLLFLRLLSVSFPLRNTEAWIFCGSSTTAQQHNCFFSLADLYTLWNPAWKIQKKRKILLMIIATMRIYCMLGGGGETLFSHICCGLFWVSLFLFFLQMPFCFSFSLLFLGFVFLSFTLKVSPEVWSMLYIYWERNVSFCLLVCIFWVGCLPLIQLDLHIFVCETNLL